MHLSAVSKRGQKTDINVRDEDRINDGYAFDVKDFTRLYVSMIFNVIVKAEHITRSETNDDINITYVYTVEVDVRLATVNG